MKMPRFLIVLAMTALAAPSIHADSQQEFLWIEQGKDSVRAKLRDSGSAQFRGVFFNRNRDGIPFACGEVNSKNAFGGMGGFQRFISAGKPDRTWLEEQVTDFHNVWDRACK